MSADHMCDHWHNGLPFVASTIPGHMVCPACNPEAVA